MTCPFPWCPLNTLYPGILLNCKQFYESYLISDQAWRLCGSTLFVSRFTFRCPGSRPNRRFIVFCWIQIFQHMLKSCSTLHFLPVIATDMRLTAAHMYYCYLAPMITACHTNTLILLILQRCHRMLYIVFGQVEPTISKVWSKSTWSCNITQL